MHFLVFLLCNSFPFSSNDTLELCLSRLPQTQQRGITCSTFHWLCESAITYVSRQVSNELAGWQTDWLPIAREGQLKVYFALKDIRLPRNNLDEGFSATECTFQASSRFVQSLSFPLEEDAKGKPGRLSIPQLKLAQLLNYTFQGQERQHSPYTAGQRLTDERKHQRGGPLKRY